MNLRQAAQQALDALEETATCPKNWPLQYEKEEKAIDALRAALAEPEPVAHKHEWFSTGAMKPGQMRCIHCGVWNHEAAPTPRKPLSDEEIADLWDGQRFYITDLKLATDFVRDIERAHGIGKQT